MNGSSRSLRSSSPVYVFLLDDDLEWVTSYNRSTGTVRSCQCDPCARWLSRSASGWSCPSPPLSPYRQEHSAPSIPHSTSDIKIISSNTPSTGRAALFGLLRERFLPGALRCPLPLPSPAPGIWGQAGAPAATAPSPLPTKSLNPPASFIAPLRLAVDAADGRSASVYSRTVSACTVRLFAPPYPRVHPPAARHHLGSTPPMGRRRPRRRDARRLGLGLALPAPSPYPAPKYLHLQASALSISPLLRPPLRAHAYAPSLLQALPARVHSVAAPHRPTVPSPSQFRF
ncbi:hypothetical protein B0H13DRAFT_2331250 [Mycena leptocephala]|nr:hypothetical protein B0H13DRAFT_2331250 [Mycena leptocephala]